MIMLSGGPAKGRAQFDDPAEAWDFKMEKQLEGARTRMTEKTRQILGLPGLCDPRIIIVAWEL